MSVLDNLKMVHERDAQDALGIAQKQAGYLKHSFNVELAMDGPIKNVVLAGMGGSALPGAFISSWPGLNVPFEIVRNYNLPPYVGPETLVISSSYSGNTEESLSTLKEAKARNAQMIIIAAGGQLAAQAKEGGYPFYEVPGGIQPRMSTFYFLKAFIDIFETMGLAQKGSLEELDKSGVWLESQVSAWLADVPTDKNQAKQLALELVGKSIVMYSGPKLYPAANKWKICFNENAKNVAWSNQYPEFNHNEFLGWTSHPVDKPYAVVELRSQLEHPRTQKRFEVSERLLSGKRPSPEVVRVQGETLLQQLLWAANLGDFVSLYLALLNGLNPTPVDLIEKLKAELNK